tara:strand:+ start:262 stop:516 length:255 start_codon:yes stop_codon:yes gene_type:complete
MSNLKSRSVLIAVAVLVLFLVICAMPKEGKIFIEPDRNTNENLVYYQVANLKPSGWPWSWGNPQIWNVDQTWQTDIPSLKQYLK